MNDNYGKNEYSRKTDAGSRSAQNGTAEGAHRYDDIINLSRPVSKRRSKMSMQDRAAQFSPFAALTGHSEAIKETARLTDKKPELDESEIARLDAKLRMIENAIRARAAGLLKPAPGDEAVKITYFVPDSRKQGGACVTHEGIAERINRHRRVLVFADKTEVPIDMICDISGAMFGNTDELW